MSDALSHLDGQYGRLLLVEDVPGVQDPVLPRREEHGGPGGAPAPVSQVLRVRAEVSDGQEIIIIMSVRHLVHMMALSLMSSLQILAHQSPTVRKFWRIKLLSFDCGHISYFWKARVSLKSVHWPKMRLVDADNSLCWCLCFPVAGEYISLCDCHCLLCSPWSLDCIKVFSTCSVPTMNLVGIVGSYSRHVAPCA